jgi:hypothetical protein
MYYARVQNLLVKAVSWPVADTEETWLGTRRHISMLLEKAAVAITPQQLDACFDEEEEAEDSIPLVTPKAMTLFWELLKYKVTPIGTYLVQVSIVLFCT